MTFVLVASAILVGIALLLGLWAIGRSAMRAWLTRRVHQQALAVREQLRELRGRDADSVDRLLIELRDTYDLSVLEVELSTALRDAPARNEGLSRAFGLLGLTDQHLKRVRDASSWRDRARSAALLGQLEDPRAIAPLVASMRDPREDDEVKLAAAESLGRIRSPDVVPLLCHELEEVDEWASPRLAQVLTMFGPAAAPELLKTLNLAKNLNACVWAAQVLGKIGDARAVAPLIERLHDRSERMRVSAANALGDIKDQRAVPPLINVILRDPVAAVRAQAALALGRIGDPSVLPLLISSLGDPEYWMRFRALEAIEALAPTDPAPLESALLDSSPEVRRRAALALDRLGFLEAPFAALAADDEGALKTARERLVLVGRAGLSERLARTLSHPDARVRSRLAEILGEIGAAVHAPALAELLADSEIEVKRSALAALGALGDPAQAERILGFLTSGESPLRLAATDAMLHLPEATLSPLGPRLCALLNHESDEVRVCAARVLAAVPGAEAEESLREAVSQRYVEVRHAAIQSLATRRSSQAVAAIATCLDDVSPKTRLAAAEALGTIGGTSAIQHLLDRVAHADAEQRDSICGTLAQQGFEWIQTALDVLLASQEVEPRLAAIWTLGKTRDQRAAGLLRSFLAEREPRLRASAAGALGKIDSDEARAALVEALNDPVPRVRSAAINSLSRSERAEIAADLSEHLQDPDPFVRNRLVLAIGRLGGPTATRALDEMCQAQHEPFAADPAFLAVALVLTGEPECVGLALATIHEPGTRSRMDEILRHEDKQVADRFFANLAIEERAEPTGLGERRIDPDSMLSHYVEVLRNSPDAQVRRSTIIVLGRLHEPWAIDSAAEAVRHDPDAEVRRLGVRELAAHCDLPAARAAILAAVRDPTSAVRVAAIEAAAAFVGADRADPLLDSLRSRDPEIVAAAERALAIIFAGPVEQFLDWMMGRENDGLLESALRVLTRIGDVRSLDLTRALMLSKNHRVRIEAGRALAAVDVPDALDALVVGLEDPIESVRVELTRALSRTSRAEVVERLTRSVQDPSAAVREALIQTLSSFAVPSALELLGRLARDPVTQVAIGAFLALSAHTAAEGQRHALTIWPDLSPEQQNAARARGDEVVELLALRLREELDHEVRESAVQLLGLLGVRRYAERIAVGLKDPDAGVRLVTIEVLEQLDPELVVDWLRALLEDPVEQVRKAAHRALVRAV